MIAPMIATQPIISAAIANPRPILFFGALLILIIPTVPKIIEKIPNGIPAIKSATIEVIKPAIEKPSILRLVSTGGPSFLAVTFFVVSGVIYLVCGTFVVFPDKLRWAELITGRLFCVDAIRPPS